MTLSAHRQSRSTSHTNYANVGVPSPRKLTLRHTGGGTRQELQRTTPTRTPLATATCECQLQPATMHTRRTHAATKGPAIIVPSGMGSTRFARPFFLFNYTLEIFFIPAGPRRAGGDLVSAPALTGAPKFNSTRHGSAPYVVVHF